VQYEAQRLPGGQVLVIDVAEEGTLEAQQDPAWPLGPGQGQPRPFGPGRHALARGRAGVQEVAEGQYAGAEDERRKGEPGERLADHVPQHRPDGADKEGPHLADELGKVEPEPAGGPVNGALPPLRQASLSQPEPGALDQPERTEEHDEQSAGLNQGGQEGRQQPSGALLPSFEQSSGDEQHHDEGDRDGGRGRGVQRVEVAEQLPGAEAVGGQQHHVAGEGVDVAEGRVQGKERQQGDPQQPAQRPVAVIVDGVTGCDLPQQSRGAQLRGHGSQRDHHRREAQHHPGGECGDQQPGRHLGHLRTDEDRTVVGHPAQQRESDQSRQQPQPDPRGRRGQPERLVAERSERRAQHVQAPAGTAGGAFRHRAIKG